MGLERVSIVGGEKKNPVAGCSDAGGTPRNAGWQIAAALSFRENFLYTSAYAVDDDGHWAVRRADLSHSMKPATRWRRW